MKRSGWAAVRLCFTDFEYFVTGRATIDVPIAEKPGMRIGRYKLVHEIGHGGMGVVYMAVQKEPVKRKVALKIIKPGMDTKEVVARSDKAIADYEQARRLDPENAQAFVQRGRSLQAKGELEKIIADYDEAIRLDPQNAELHYWRGDRLQELGRYEESIRDLTEAIRLDSEYVDAYKCRALAHFNSADFDEALADITEVVKQNPKDTHSLFLIPTSQMAVCEDEAFRKGLLELSDEIIEQTDGSPRAYAGRGYLYATFGQHTEASRDLSKAVEFAQEDLVECNGVAWYLATAPGRESRDISPAVELAKRAVELNPRSMKQRRPNAQRRNNRETGQPRCRCVTPSAYGRDGANDHPGCAANDRVVSRRPWALECNRFAVKRRWDVGPFISGSATHGTVLYAEGVIPQSPGSRRGEAAERTLGYRPHNTRIRRRRYTNDNNESQSQT